MKFKLHNNEELTLPIQLGYDDRVNLLNNEILNHDNHEFYYNKNSLRLSDSEIDNISKRWIGVKKVNVPHPDETLKISFDIMSTYLVYSKDYSVLKDINRFTKLILKKKSKREQDTLDESEEKELYKLKSHVKFYKIFSKSSPNNIGFYVNNKFEKFIEERLLELEQIDNDDVCSTSDLTRTKIRLRYTSNRILDIKDKLNDYVLELNDTKNHVSEIKEEIKTLYQELKLDKKNQFIVDEIKSKINLMKKLQFDISFTENSIKDLSDDYLQLTELFI